MTTPTYANRPLSMSQIRAEFGVDTPIVRQPASGEFYQGGYLWSRLIQYDGESNTWFWFVDITWNGVTVYSDDGIGPNAGNAGNFISVNVGNNTIYYRGTLNNTDVNEAGTTYSYGVYRTSPVPNLDPAPYALRDYLAGAPTGYVPLGSVGFPLGGPAVTIPSSGVLGMGNFFGATKEFVFNYTLNNGSFDTNFNLLSRATTAGFLNTVSDPPLRANITINGVLGASSRSVWAFDTATGYARTPTITVTIGPTGYITGAGGQTIPGPNAWVTGTGGSAMRLQVATRVINNGIIQGGGGSGQAGQGGMFGGGAGYLPGPGVLGEDTYTGAAVGTLNSGGSWQNDGGKAGDPNGGAGGGWVATWNGLEGTTSVNGYGLGSWFNTGDVPGITNGGYPPGTAISGWASFAISGSVQGTVRGWIDANPPGPPGEPPQPPPDPAPPPTCFLAGSMVLMYDGSYKPIEFVKVGEFVVGAFGEMNEVLALDRTLLGSRYMYKINNEHSTTAEHPHVSVDGKFYAQDIAATYNEYGIEHDCLINDNETKKLILHGIKPGQVHQLTHGIVLKTANGSKEVESLEQYSLPGDTQLFNLVLSGSHTYFVDNYAVGGWLRDDDFDYYTWTTRPVKKINIENYNQSRDV